MPGASSTSTSRRSCTSASSSPPPGPCSGRSGPGTMQNFAAVLGTYRWGKAGRYLFDLTPLLLNTAYLPNGSYRVTIRALDTAGNLGTRSTVVQVRNTRATIAAPVRTADDMR